MSKISAKRKKQEIDDIKRAGKMNEKKLRRKKFYRPFLITDLLVAARRLFFS